MSEPSDVVLYGATGYTGRLVAAELHRRGARFVIAGRDSAKLDALAATVGKPAILVAALDDRSALLRMAESARVVLDCAGPFARFGRPVLEAALAAGRHFLDVTGEQEWMRETFARDGEARERGCALVNAVGFDVVPTDAASVLAAEAAGAPIEKLRIAFANRGARPTQGTTRSALAAAHLGGVAFVDGEFRREPVGVQKWQVAFPDPIGGRTCISVPWGDVATAPRSTGAREVRCFMAVSRRTARFARLVTPLGRLFALGPIARLGERWVRSLPEGPSDEQRAGALFAVVAEATGAHGTRAVWVTGGDGYDFTAASAATCALLAAHRDFTARGALTPTQAFGARPLLDALAPAGVRYGLLQCGDHPP